MKFSDRMKEALRNGDFLISTADEAPDGLADSEVQTTPQEGQNRAVLGLAAPGAGTALLVPLTDHPLDSTKGKKMIPVKHIGDPAKFKRVVAGAYRCYLRFGNVQADVVAGLSALDPGEVDFYLRSQELAFALACRGIDLSLSGHGLTPEQDHVLMVISDTTSRDNLNTRLRKAGVTNNTLLAWRKNPAFDAEYRRVTEAITGNYENALLELDRKVGEGDQRAIEKKLEISGRYNPATQNTVDALAIINRVVEILAIHLSDQPDLLRKIAGDLAETAKEVNQANKPREIGGF